MPIATSPHASNGSPGRRPEDKDLVRRLVYVAFFIEVGLLLVIVPWSAFWDQNYFAGTWPWLRNVVTNNFVRGGISGLGVVNLIAGLADLTGMFGRRERTGLALRDGSERPL